MKLYKDEVEDWCFALDDLGLKYNIEQAAYEPWHVYAGMPYALIVFSYDNVLMALEIVGSYKWAFTNTLYCFTDKQKGAVTHFDRKHLKRALDFITDLVLRADLKTEEEGDTA
jgi:hypothetical protein